MEEQHEAVPGSWTLEQCVAVWRDPEVRHLQSILFILFVEVWTNVQLHEAMNVE